LPTIDYQALYLHHLQSEPIAHSFGATARQQQGKRTEQLVRFAEPTIILYTGSQRAIKAAKARYSGL